MTAYRSVKYSRISTWGSGFMAGSAHNTQTRVTLLVRRFIEVILNGNFNVYRLLVCVSCHGSQCERIDLTRVEPGTSA
jgi:hypothetical protein